ncbi:[protein-PII] uridylyltransferase [Prauserella isguenensis]|uniref:Bifunctional uridylyltransferase/uridylyl-removing enzyme n=1 Tax=Prauserella isguenensis TaxID=1470180 RepID=A0A839S319_9PSEU|nr:[protein-PII] uridylyltransferase [Prauserella isguenensis]
MVVGGLVEAAERLLEGRHGRLGATALRAALVDLYEFWLSKAVAAAGADASGVLPDGVALVAVGGLGRRELVPFSDLDLILIHNGHPNIGEIADALWYPLWDARIGLDHSVRTPSEALKVASEDLRTAMGLLDGRLIAGDADLASRLVGAARDQWRRTARKRVPELFEYTRERWRRSGEIAQSSEPDLKHGRGGLRDLVVLDAFAAAQLADRPGEELTAARELLLDVRTDLRRTARRSRDVLSAEDAAVVASELDLGDRFALARRLSGAGRTVAYAVDVALRAADPPKGRFGRRPSRSPLDDGVVLHSGEVALARDAVPARDPGLLLRVAAASARTGNPISHGTLRTLADAAPELRAPWPESARRALTELLGAGDGLVDAVEALDRTGLWARLLPEWGAVRDLPPRAPVHAWTVDRHLVEACVEAAGLTDTVARPDLLLLGTLLHDIGKGRRADHSELGAEIAGHVAVRIGLSERDTNLVVGMARHHLLLPDTATRRDISEPETVERVAKTIDGDPLLLDLLHALAKADSRATGPGVWTHWKAGLVAELVSRTRTLLAGRPLPEPEAVDATQRELVAEAVRATRGQVTVTPSRPRGEVTTVVFAAPAGAELLTPAAGVLALNSLEVHTATLRTHAGGRVGVFTASPRFGTPPDPALLRDQFARAVAGRLALAQKLAEKERAYAGAPAGPVSPKVLWFDDETAGAETVVVELRAMDRIALLHRVAGALRRSDAEVRWAKVETLGDRVVDSFAVGPRTGTLDAAWRGRLEQALLAAAG